MKFAQSRPKRYDLAHKAHTVVHEHRHSGTSSRNRGISSMCAFDSVSHQFLSGGEDGTIHLWSVARTDGAYSATSRKLMAERAHPIQCMAYNVSENRLLSCYAQYIHTADLEASQPTSAIVLSSRAQQIHIHPENPAVVILEVRLRPADWHAWIDG